MEGENLIYYEPPLLFGRLDSCARRLGNLQKGPPGPHHDLGSYASTDLEGEYQFEALV